MSRLTSSKFSIVLSSALLLLALPGRHSWGHAYPALSLPNNGATVKEPPRELRIQFTEAVEIAFSQITVKAANGNAVSQDKLRQLASDTLAIDLKPLARETTASSGRCFPSTRT